MREGRPDYLSRRSFLKGAGTLAATVPLGMGGAFRARPKARSGASTKIVFSMQKQEVIPYFENLVAKYAAANPGVAITLDTESNQTVDLVRNDPPDLSLNNYGIASGNYWRAGVLGSLAGTAAAANVSPKVQALTNSFGSIQGTLCAVPFSSAAAGVVYDRGIFAKYNAKIPKTWSQFVSLCEMFQSKGVTPIYGTYQDAWTVMQGMADYSMGGMIGTSSAPNPGGITSEAAWVAKLNEIGADLTPDNPYSFSKMLPPVFDRVFQIMKYANKDADSQHYANGNTAMAAGQAAMYFQGPWAITEIEVINPKASMGSFAFPATDDARDTKVWIDVDLGAFIPEQTEHRDEAMNLMSWLFEPAQMYAYNKVNWYFSPVRNPPSQHSPEVSDLSPSFLSGRVYLGGAWAFPTDVEWVNICQECVLNQSYEGPLRTLDNNWARVALRKGA